MLNFSARKLFENLLQFCWCIKISSIWDFEISSKQHDIFRSFLSWKFWYHPISWQLPTVLKFIPENVKTTEISNFEFFEIHVSSERKVISNWFFTEFLQIDHIIRQTSTLLKKNWRKSQYHRYIKFWDLTISLKWKEIFKRFLCKTS